MLRTIFVRNENLLRGTVRRATQANVVRCLSYECAKRINPQR